MAISNKDLYENLEKLRKELESDIKDIDTKVEKTYTRLVQFTPVKNIVYGLVAIILSGFMGAVLVSVGL